jgi:hypothetical protein
MVKFTKSIKKLHLLSTTKMKNTLITIDSYLSDEERGEVCKNLIGQIREVFGYEYEILLINKSNKDWGLQKEVEYYYNLSNSFLVGFPPENILVSEKYERPYVYVDTGFGTCENWLPLTGVTDHVAGIYNSFILSSKISKMMGYTHVFKIEYDTIFDIDELNDIKKDLEKEKDYIFYGGRKMGEYAKDHHYLIDVHIVGYNNRLFEGFDFVKNDDDFWRLNEKINYYGKWIEFIIPSIFEYQKINNTYDGIEYMGYLRDQYSKTKFDIINGIGGWTEKWKSIPKICYLKNDQENFGFGLFFWSQDYDNFETVVEIRNENGDLIYEKTITLNKNHYFFEKIVLNDEKLFIKKINKIDGLDEIYDEVITKESINNSSVHFKYNN